MKKILSGEKGKTPGVKRLVLVFSFVSCFASCASFVFSQGMPENTDAGIVSLEKTAQGYFASRDYDGFYEYLKNMGEPGPEAYYYMALCRQKTIEYWEATKNWEGVYDKTGAYKKEIAGSLKLAEEAAKDDHELLLKIKHLKWLQSKAGSHESAQGMFNDLVNTAKGGSSPGLAGVIKDIADELTGFEDKNLSRRLYEVYAAKLIESGLPADDLKTEAGKFLKDKNTYLAKVLFEAYLEKISGDKDTWARQAVKIADLFAHQGRSEAVDPIYAEEIYKRAYASAGSVVFEGDSLYRRAFNLERLKEYKDAAEAYAGLLAGYPDYSRKAAVNFRLGVLSAYGLKDKEAAVEYFLKVKDDEAAGQMSLSALYQIGLLNQYNGENDKAAEFYRACIDTAKGLGLDVENNEICRKCADRLSETADGRGLKYSLKLFLDGIYKSAAVGEAQGGAGLNVDLAAYPARQDKGNPVRFVVTTSNPQTGCMVPVYAYEWSGETGTIENIPNTPELTTDYPVIGIKVVNVAVVGPAGLEGSAFDMAEIAEK